MCGIAGIYRYKTGQFVEQSEIEDMIRVINYRGPDGEGIYTQKNIGFGHKRLSIIDASERSNQPMSSPNKFSTLCYNGEVYNYLELAEPLTQQGIERITQSDTEVVLQLLMNEGIEVLQKFNGMFAFSYWDSKKQQLFLARDRVGIKPLFYKETREGIIFASEIKSILAVDPSPCEVNKTLIDSYMSLGYCPTDDTLFKDIKKLAPGHYLTVLDNEIVIEKYWDMTIEREKDRGESYYIQQTQSLFKDAVKLQLRSDVPLGVFLSGGVDSSAVVAMMSELGIQDIKTFSVAWDYGKDFDETQYARQISKQYRTDHTEYFMTAEDFINFMPEFIRHMDEPVAESAAISLYYLALKTKEQVTVVLSGEGADEVFSGYPIYKYMEIVSKYKKLPNAVKKILTPVLILLSKKFKKYIKLSQLPLEHAYAGVSFYDEALKEQLYSTPQLNTSKSHSSFSKLKQYYQRVSQVDDQGKMQYLDIKTWLVDDLLVKADRMSMAASLELRVPFLDHRFLEFAGKLPIKYRNKGFESKYLLKKALEPWLDNKILYRKKQGFPTPLAIMFKTSLKEYLTQTLDSEIARSRGYFNPDTIRKLLDEHSNNHRDHHKVLWQLLVLELWHREYID